MCISIYIYICMHTYIHIYTCIHTYPHTYILTFILTYLHTDIHTYRQTDTQTYKNMHTYKHTYVHTNIQKSSIHKCMCKYVYIYICTHLLRRTACLHPARVKVNVIEMLRYPTLIQRLAAMQRLRVRSTTRYMKCCLS